MTLTDRSVNDLMRALESPQPTPGGGSASALAGAAGAALLAMVAGLPKPRASSEEDLERLRAARTRCADLSRQLTELINRDADAYDAVVAAFRLPKTTDDERARRTAGIQTALRAATETPLDVMRASAAALADAAAIATLANRNASSDVLVALELLGAGLRGAGLNVDINLPSLTDAAFVARIAADRAALAASADAAVRRCQGVFAENAAG